MGQIGQAFSNPNTFAAQPSGFNGSEWAARFAGTGAKGLGQGLQNQQQQNAAMRQGGGAAPIDPGSGAAPVDMNAFAPRNFTPGPGTGDMTTNTRARNPFFYGYGQGG